MNRKGQIDLGSIMLMFIAVLVGVILFQVIAQEVGSATTTVTLNNLSLGTQTNATTYYLTDYRSLSSVIIVGNTTPITLAAGNYTVTNNVVDPTTGGLAVSILPASEYTATTWYLNATAEPVTYIADSGGRAMAGLIVIFFALAVVIVAISPVLRSDIMNMVGK